MNKSLKNRIWGWAMLLIAAVILFSIAAPLKFIILGIWGVFLLYYLYPEILGFIALISHNYRGKETYLKFMSPAYRSGRLNPKWAATYSYILLKEGSLDDAAAVLAYAEERAEERKPWRNGQLKYKHIHSYRALILWKQGKLDEAVELLQELLSDDYRTTTLYANLGWFLIKQGRLDDAMTLNLEALEYDRSDAILDNIGLNYLKLGNLEKCRAIYTELIKREPKFPDAWFNYGQLLKLDGREEEAADMFQKARNCVFSFLGTVTIEEVEQALK